MEFLSGYCARACPALPGGTIRYKNAAAKSALIENWTNLLPFVHKNNYLPNTLLAANNPFKAAGKPAYTAICIIISISSSFEQPVFKAP